MVEGIHELVCACGEIVSGPDKTAVEATMKRHQDEKHPKRGTKK